jgi:hypothetical protein
LGFTISRLLHQNLLKQNAEKILLIKPLNYRGDYRWNTNLTFSNLFLKVIMTEQHRNLAIGIGSIIIHTSSHPGAAAAHNRLEIGKIIPSFRI